MGEFELKGQNGIVRIAIKEVFGFPNNTSHFGGYECILGVEIKVNSYSVKSSFYSTTGELSNFFKKLRKCHIELSGIADFNSCEENLDLIVKYDFGKVNISGKYQENLAIDNKLEFDFETDQSYLKEGIDKLERITEKYGGLKGVNK